jgi:phage terminase large subunit-like protein
VPQRLNPWDKPGLNRPERVIAFCEDMTVTSGMDSGKKLILRQWQKDFIWDVYSENDRGVRVVRTAIFSMARKNGKTELAAALALCHLSGPESEERGECYACANDRFQAGKIFNEMEAMVNHHAWLQARINISKFKKEMEDLFNGSIYCTLTSEAKTKFGLSPSFSVYDELGQSYSRDLYDALDSAMGARSEPLMMVISTQAADSYAPMSQLVDYGLKVNAGEIDDPAFHLTLYAAPDDADPWDPATWEMANPALGDFRSLEDVERLAAQAQRMPSQENAFRNLILNQRVASEARFMEPSLWKACGGAPSFPDGLPVFAGLDLGSTRDPSALVVVRQDVVTGEFHVRPYVWVPGDLRARGEEEGVPYDVWERQGIIIKAGEATDPRAIAKKIAEVNARTPIKGLAFDRWRIIELKREMDQIGCQVPLIPHGQGFKDMSPAVDAVERLVVQKKLRHGNNPVLTWMAHNAVVLMDPAGGRKFDKSKLRYRSRIDAMVAMAMGIAAIVVKEQPKNIDIEALIA